MRKPAAFLGIFLCLSILLSLLPIHAQAEVAGEAYDQLQSELHKQVYHILEEGIASLAPVISFPEDMVIYSYELSNIARAVCVDHPEYFWFLESWFFNYEAELQKKRVTSITPSYLLDGEQVSASSQELADAMIAFHSKVNEIITGIPMNCTSDYDIALYLHDYLIDHVTYSLDGNHDSAYSALIHGQAACYGYSKAYQYLLTVAGVRSRTITGESVDADGNKDGHAWNQVWIDDVCYYTDVTWDDMDIDAIHAYFLRSLDTFSVDHIAETAFILPSCSHALNYHDISQGKGTANLKSQSRPKTAAQYFRMSDCSDDTASYVCEIRFSGDFLSWFDKYGLDIVKQLGLSYRTTMSYYYNNDIYYVILTDPNYKQPVVTAQSITLNLSDAALSGVGTQVQLQTEVTPADAALLNPVYTSSDEAIAVVSSTGMVTAVGFGTAVITAASADGSVSATCMITVTEGQEHTHTLRSILDSDPTCTQDGCDSYFLCTSCGRRFADAAGELELKVVKDYARPATGHLDTKWETTLKTHVKVCSCGEKLTDTNGAHIDTDQNLCCDICDSPYLMKSTDTADSQAESKIPVKSFPPVSIGIGAVSVIAVLIIIIKRRR